eukprot:110336-Chlamydomonas_euryale.AAC.1
MAVRPAAHTLPVVTPPQPRVTRSALPMPRRPHDAKTWQWKPGTGTKALIPHHAPKAWSEGVGRECAPHSALTLSRYSSLP